MITYRKATTGDAAQIAAIGATVWISTYAENGVEPSFARYVLEHFTAGAVQAGLAEPDRHYWVAALGEALLGFVELKLHERSACVPARAQAEVARLYVLERFTRRGVGRRLLEESLAFAAAQGTETAWLSAYERNDRALAFYRTHGWQECGEYAFELEGAQYRNLVLASPLLPAGA